MPLYMYLDQRDLIDSVHRPGSVLRGRLERLIQDGRAQIVLSLTHGIETWKYQGSAGRRAIAEFADSLNPLWLLNRDYLFQEEARAVAYEYFGFPIRIAWAPGPSGQGVAGVGNPEGCFCPFRRSLLQVFPQSRLECSENKSENSMSFASFLNAMDQAPSILSALLQLDDTYAEAQPSARLKRTPLSGRRDFTSYVFYQAFADMPPRGAQILSHLGTTVDLRRCPALYTYLHVREAVHRDATARLDASEMEDMVHLTALPYVDAFSTDKRIADYIRRTSITPDVFPADRVREMRVFKSLGSAVDWLEAYG